MSDEFDAKLSSLRRKYDKAFEDASFSDISSTIGDLSGTVASLPADVEAIRSRGYAFRSYLEQKAEVLSNNWDDTRRQVQRAIDDERDRLRNDVRDVEKYLTRAERLGAKGGGDTLDDAESELNQLESRARSAKSRINSMFSTMQNDIESTKSQISKINWYMDQKDEASFEFLAGESVFLVAKAEWVVTGKGKQDPDGMLFLTDQRMIFEQKEKVGKRLGMFGGKEVQEVEWAIPLHQFEDVEAENKGLFGGKDMLNFTLSSGAPHPKITVEVKGGVDCKFWAKQVQRMKTGEASDERAIEPDPELIETLRNAPTNCHVCGATLPQIMAGQMQIDCQYCGSVIRL